MTTEGPVNSLGQNSNAATPDSTQQSTTPLPQKRPLEPTNSTIYAGFFIREAALILDTLIGIVPAMLISALITLPFAKLSGEPLNQAFDKPPASIIFNSLTGLLIWSYFIFMTYKHGATLGKKVFKLQVVSEGGEPLTLGKTIIREVPGKIISSLILAIGYLMVGFSKEKQALHDHLAGTHVVRTEPITGRTKIAVILTILFPFLIFITIFAAMMFVLLTINPTKNKGTIQNNKNSGTFSLDAYQRDAKRKNDVAVISVELQYYYQANGNYPQDLLQLPLSENTDPNSLKQLPIPPQSSEPSSSYGYISCLANRVSEAVIYSRLEDHNYYWVWRSKINKMENTGTSGLPQCP